jgi:hypothetical protein
MTVPNLVFVEGVLVSTANGTLVAIANAVARWRRPTPIPFNAAPTAAPE